MKTKESKMFDPNAWVELHADYLFRYAMFRLRDREAAEDAVQETLLAGVQARSSFAHRSSERTWLTGILRHKIIDHLRNHRRTVALGDDDGQNGIESVTFEKAGPWVGHWCEESAPLQWNMNAQELVEQREFWKTLDRCLSALPQRTAIAFTLKEIDGFSCEELCEVLNVSRNNLWVILHRARLQLRQSLEAEWFSKTGKNRVERRTKSLHSLNSYESTPTYFKSAV